MGGGPCHLGARSFVFLPLTSDNKFNRRNQGRRGVTAAPPDGGNCNQREWTTPGYIEDDTVDRAVAGKDKEE